MEVHSGIWFEDYTRKSAIEFVFDAHFMIIIVLAINVCMFDAE